jgi:hypothetical protein
MEVALVGENKQPSADKRRRPGRLYLVLGVLLALAGLGIYAAQFRARALTTPWYVPILATVGAALALAALARSRSAWRWAATALLTLLAGAEWAFLLVLMSTPPYAGPAKAGQPFPVFTTTLADGSPFTQDDLSGRKSTVLVFFRGRW